LRFGWGLGLAGAFAEAPSFRFMLASTCCRTLGISVVSQPSVSIRDCTWCILFWATFRFLLYYENKPDVAYEVSLPLFIALILVIFQEEG